MKQNITLQQLNELGIPQKAKLAMYALKSGWAKHEEYENGGYIDIPLLSIGQMIEFLDEEGRLWIEQEEAIDGEILKRYRVQSRNFEYWRPELCDALWEAVKEVLNAS